MGDIDTGDIPRFWYADVSCELSPDRLRLRGLCGLRKVSALLGGDSRVLDAFDSVNGEELELGFGAIESEESEEDCAIYSALRVGFSRPLSLVLSIRSCPGCRF